MPASRGEVWAAVPNLVAGGTNVALTTYYLDEANELADHVVVIDDGHAIASGTLR
jgi:ABC-2 type transport system ATP-binding protein